MTGFGSWDPPWSVSSGLLPGWLEKLHTSRTRSAPHRSGCHKAIHISVFPLKSTSAILLFIEDGVKRYRKFYRSLRKLPKDDQLAAINYLVFSYTENVFMNPTTHKELRKNDLFMDMCRKSTDFRSHTPFPLDDPLEAAVKEFSLSKRNDIPNLLSRDYALNWKQLQMVSSIV